MENKFKFGDIVRSKVNPLKNKGIIVGDGTNEHMKNVWWDCAKGSLHGEEIVSLELIPHPDTVRLSWLEKEMLEDSHQTIVCDGYNGFCNIVTFREHTGLTFETIREAIDHEMKKQGKP